jgi:hypothetical protein
MVFSRIKKPCFYGLLLFSRLNMTYHEKISAADQIYSTYYKNNIYEKNYLLFSRSEN